MIGGKVVRAGRLNLATSLLDEGEGAEADQTESHDERAQQQGLSSTHPINEQ